MVIVYYDTLAGVGNQSLIYSIDQNEICFLIVLNRCQRQFLKAASSRGICRQAIVIDDCKFQMHSSKLN